MLSGGERLRLGLARLILTDNNALFLDEPTNYLDIATLEVLEKTLIEYPGLVIIISHDSKFVDKLATRKLLIKIDEISSASLADKLRLEKRYNQVIAELKDN